MAEIEKIKELARTLCLMNIANGVIDLNDETVSNLVTMSLTSLQVNR